MNNQKMKAIYQSKLLNRLNVKYIFVNKIINIVTKSQTIKEKTTQEISYINKNKEQEEPRNNSNNTIRTSRSLRNKWHVSLHHSCFNRELAQKWNQSEIHIAMIIFAKKE